MFSRLNLLIDTANRQNTSQTSTNFDVMLASSYKVKVARLKQICIPLTNFNITSANNTLKVALADGGGGFTSLTITLDNGRYTITDLYDAINTQLTAGFAGTSIEFLNYNGKTKLTGDGTNNIKIRSASLLATQLGFADDQIDVDASSVTSTNPTSFLDPEYFKLSIDILTSNTQTIDTNGSSLSFLVEIPDDNTINYYGKRVQVENIVDDNGLKNNVYDNPITLQKFKVILADQDNNTVDLNNANWWAVIELIIQTDNSSPNLTATDYLAPLLSAVPTYLLSNSSAKQNYPWLF